jgi:hypothetical protein
MICWLLQYNQLVLQEGHKDAKFTMNKMGGHSPDLYTSTGWCVLLAPQSFPTLWNSSSHREIKDRY